ncbi:MAG TPA: hypothetical protein VI815_00390 [Candidatus Nanoarchaeia archaeon]|nr:hypothetical protein [Candidatus Nanoarchaeia archaeon]
MKNILIVGEEQSGKTTLMERLVHDLFPKRGFLTSETSEILSVNDKGEVVEGNDGVKIERVNYSIRPFFAGRFQDEVELGYVDFLGDDVLRAVQNYTKLSHMVKSLMGKRNGDITFADEITLMDGYVNFPPFYELTNKFLNEGLTFIGTISPCSELKASSLPKSIATVLEARPEGVGDTKRFELTNFNRDDIYREVMSLVPNRYKAAA